MRTRATSEALRTPMTASNNMIGSGGRLVVHAIQQDANVWAMTFQ